MIASASSVSSRGLRADNLKHQRINPGNAVLCMGLPIQMSQIRSQIEILYFRSDSSLGEIGRRSNVVLDPVFMCERFHERIHEDKRMEDFETTWGVANVIAALGYPAFVMSRFH